MKYLSFIIFIVSNLNYRYFPVLFTVVYRFLPGQTEKAVPVSTVKNVQKNVSTSSQMKNIPGVG